MDGLTEVKNRVQSRWRKHLEDTGQYTPRLDQDSMRMIGWHSEDARSLFAEIISDWITELAEKDDGKIFMAATRGIERAPVTYGDLRGLMQMLEKVTHENS